MFRHTFSFVLISIYGMLFNGKTTSHTAARLTARYLPLVVTILYHSRLFALFMICYWGLFTIWDCVFTIRVFISRHLKLSSSKQQRKTVRHGQQLKPSRTRQDGNYTLHKCIMFPKEYLSIEERETETA